MENLSAPILAHEPFSKWNISKTKKAEAKMYRVRYQDRCLIGSHIFRLTAWATGKIQGLKNPSRGNNQPRELQTNVIYKLLLQQIYYSRETAK